MEIKNISVELLVSNDGQIKGLPRNPRLIRTGKFERLKKSLLDDPEMLNLRELLVYPYGMRFVVIAGNMRCAAAKDVGFKELPCKVLPLDTPVEKLRAYTIKDNVSFGEDSDDMLTEWDEIELQDFGMDMFVETDDNEFLPTPKPIKNDPVAEFEAHGEFQYVNEDKTPLRSVVIHFESEEDFEAFQDITGLPLTNKTKFSYFPAKAREASEIVYE